jgi:hypothetical protein
MTKIKNPEKKITFNHKNINHFCKSKDSARSKKIVKDNTKMNNVKEEGRGRGRGRGTCLGLLAGWPLDFGKFGRRREGGCSRVGRLSS